MARFPNPTFSYCLEQLLRAIASSPGGAGIHSGAARHPASHHPLVDELLQHGGQSLKCGFIVVLASGAGCKSREGAWEVVRQGRAGSSKLQKRVVLTQTLLGVYRPGLVRLGWG